MFTAKSFICLDFGAGTVKAAEFELNQAGSLALKKYCLQSLGSEGGQESKREKAVSAATRDLLAARGINAREGNLCAPGFQVFSRFVKLPPVDNAKARQIIQYEARQNVPYPLEEAVWDFQILGAAATGELEVLLVAMKAEVVEGLFRVAEAGGLKVQLVDAAPAALCNAFRFNYGDLEGCSLLLDIGAKTSNILIFENGKVFARTLNIGANAITQDLVAETKMPFAKAEELKISEGFVSLGGAYADPEHPHEAAISKIARQVLTRLHIQVNQTIQFYRGQQGGTAPSRVFLAGGGSSMPYTTEFFAEKLNVPVEYFNPFRNLTIDRAVDLPELAKVAHVFGETVGLGLRNLARCPVELNLIPKSIRAKQKFNQRKPYLAAAMVSLIVGIFAVGFFVEKGIETKKQALADINRELLPLQKRAAEMEKQQSLLTRAKDEVDVYTGYLRNRYFWPEALVEMRNLLVKVEEKLHQPGREVGVWVENFGAVDPVEDEEPDVTANSPANPGGIGKMGVPNWLLENPVYFERLYPQLYKIFKDNGWLKPTDGINLMAQKPPQSTNLVTINVRFKAVSLNNPNDPAANGRLAFTVAEEFKNSGLFDPNGTKLTGDLEEPEMLTDKFGTFRFGMTLKLKNEMQL